MILGITTLLIALLISTVSAWYSILGLTAIFAGAVMPAIIMGISLELGKVMVAVWLHQNWKRDRLLKFYLIPALIFLMMLTSVGVFGFLSKAHVDQNLVSGDVIAEIAIFDEKIRTERENIDVNRKQLKQMDEAVDQVMGRSSDEKGAERAVTIRRSQQKERGRLLADITTSQKRISALNEERAPIAAKVRKVEAEVGPIKYVAALFSTNTPDQDQLERAVRWVIILIVIVFDPLAIVLIIAGISQLGWSRQKSVSSDFNYSHSGISPLKTIDELIADITPENTHPEINLDVVNTQLAELVVEREAEYSIVDTAEKQDPRVNDLENDLIQAKRDAELLVDFVQKQDQELTQVKEVLTDLYDDQSKLTELNLRSMQREQSLTAQLELALLELARIQQERDQVAQEMATMQEQDSALGEFFEQAHDVAQEIDVGTYTAPHDFPEYPQDNIPLTEEQNAQVEESVYSTPEEIVEEIIQKLPMRQPSAEFGSEFPGAPNRGDMYLRTDFKPSRLFKWNDVKWIEVNKNTTDVYNYNDAYLQFLVEKVSSGEYSFDDLNDTEQHQVRALLGVNR